jgi:hypothetical protein
VKNRAKMWSRRPRLLFKGTAGGGCSTFFILGGEPTSGHERLACATQVENLCHQGISFYNKGLGNGAREQNAIFPLGASY